MADDNSSLLDDEYKADDAAASQAGADGDQASSASDDGGQAPPPAPSWRDQAKEHAGLDLSEHADDAAAWKHVADLRARAEQADAARQERDQYKQLAQYGNEYVQHAPQFRQWMTEQQAAAAKAAPEEPLMPEYDPSWITKIKRTDDGEIVPDIAAGGSPEIVSKLLTHMAWRQEFQANPFKHLERFVDQRAKQLVDSTVQERLAAMNSQVAATQFIDRNRDWLYAKDDGGKPTQQLSEEGQWFQKDLSDASELGMTDKQQEAYALRMLGMRRQLANPPKSNGEKKDDFLKKAAGHGASSGASAIPQLRSDDSSQNQNMSLADRLRADLAAAGIDDKTFATA